MSHFTVTIVTTPLTHSICFLRCHNRSTGGNLLTWFLEVFSSKLCQDSECHEWDSSGFPSSRNCGNSTSGYTTTASFHLFPVHCSLSRDHSTLNNLDNLQNIRREREITDHLILTPAGGRRQAYYQKAIQELRHPSGFIDTDSQNWAVMKRCSCRMCGGKGTRSVGITHSYIYPTFSLGDARNKKNSRKLLYVSLAVSLKFCCLILRY